MLLAHILKQQTIGTCSSSQTYLSCSYSISWMTKTVWTSSEMLLRRRSGSLEILAWPEEPIAAAEWLVRLGCIAVLGDHSADFRRIVTERELPALSSNSADWGVRVWSSVLDVWLRLLRKKGWEDLDAVQGQIVAIREAQRAIEPAFLKEAEARKDVVPAWELMAHYHLAKAAEILGAYVGQGSVDGHYDIREQLEAQFDRAIGASARGQLVERETLSRLLARGRTRDGGTTASGQ